MSKATRRSLLVSDDDVTVRVEFAGGSSAVDDVDTRHTDVWARRDEVPTSQVVTAPIDIDADVRIIELDELEERAARSGLALPVNTRIGMGTEMTPGLPPEDEPTVTDVDELPPDPVAGLLGITGIAPRFDRDS